MTAVVTETKALADRRALRAGEGWAPLDDVLSVEDCGWLLREVRQVEPLTEKGPGVPSFRVLPSSVQGSYRLQPVLRALDAANGAWRLPRDRWHMTVSEYVEGDSFPPHRDYSPRHPDAAPAITYAASVLLVDPREFTGGEVYMRGTAVPRAQGCGAVFHTFTPHCVERLYGGRRLALNIFATLGTVAEAKQVGWPTRWLYARDRPAPKPARASTAAGAA